MPDYVIVGGGVYGCGVAWQLARRGAEVALLEARRIASGASGGSGKRGVRANGRDLRELPLMGLAYAAWPTLHDELGAPTGYEQTGHLLLIERDWDHRAASARAWLQVQKGIPTHLVERDQLHAMEPHLSDLMIAALHCPVDGVADHTATTRALADAARRLGAEIREGVMVSELERRDDRVMAVLTTQEERVPVRNTLLLLSNTHVPEFVKTQLDITLPVWWRLPQVVFTEPVDPNPVRHLIGHAHRTLAMKQGPGGGVMISGGWSGRWNPETDRGETRSDQVAGNLAEAVAVYPSLAGVRVQHAAADRLESQAVDEIPIIDKLPGATNLLVATGWSGHGWAIAPAVTRLLADWALTGERPDLLRPFGYDRF
jgi:sarcosine oxidase subunit beta